MAELLLQVDTESIVTSVAFSPNNAFIAFGNMHGEVHLLFLTPGREINPDESFNSDDYDWENKQYPRTLPVTSFKPHNSAVRHISWLSDTEIISCGADALIVISKLHNLELTESDTTATCATAKKVEEPGKGTPESPNMAGHIGRVQSIGEITEMAPQDTDPDFSDVIFEVCTILSTNTRHPIVTFTVFEHEGIQYIAAGNDEGTVYLYRARSLDASAKGASSSRSEYAHAKLVQELFDAADYVSAIYWAPRRQELVVASGDGTIYAYAVQKDAGKNNHAGEGFLQLCLRDNSSPEEHDNQCMVLDESERICLVGSSRGDIQLYRSLSIALPITTIKSRSRSVESIVHLSHNIFAIGCEDGSIKTFSLSPPSLLGTLGQPSQLPVTVLAKTGDGSLLAASGFTNRIYLLDVSWILTLEHPKQASFFSETSSERPGDESSDGDGSEVNISTVPRYAAEEPVIKVAVPDVLSNSTIYSLDITSDESYTSQDFEEFTEDSKTALEHEEVDIGHQDADEGDVRKTMQSSPAAKTTDNILKKTLNNGKLAVTIIKPGHIDEDPSFDAFFDVSDPDSSKDLTPQGHAKKAVYSRNSKDAKRQAFFNDL